MKLGDTVMRKKRIRGLALLIALTMVFVNVLPISGAATDAAENDYNITVTYGPEAGIPEDADVVITEILPETEEYQTYLQGAAEAMGRDGTEGIRFARFFDIRIISNGDEIEPLVPVSVKIELNDVSDESQEDLTVIHFDEEDGPTIMETEPTDDADVAFETESFSVYGVITDPVEQVDPPQSVANLDGWSTTISRNGQYVTANVDWSSPFKLTKTDNPNEAAVWTFELDSYQYGYYLYKISTMVNGQKYYLHMWGVEQWWGATDDAHVTIQNGSNPGLNSQGYPQNFAVITNNDGTYSIFINTNQGNHWYYLNEYQGTQGNGFAGWSNPWSSDHNDNGSHLTFDFEPQYRPKEGEYAVLVKHNGTYYAVQNDGSLEEVIEYNEATNEVTLDYPLFWTYSITNVNTEIGQQDVTNLKISTEAKGYDQFQLPTGYWYRYIDPNSDTGISDDDKEHDNDWNVWDKALRYNNNGRRELSGRNFSFVNCIGVDDSTMTIKGNVPLEQAAEVYFAKVKDIPAITGGPNDSNNEIVSHIDIAIEGQGFLDVPLAYGSYKNSEGEVVLTVSEGNDVTLHLEETVPVVKEDIMNAAITAYDTNGVEQKDAFYVTGYSANAQSFQSLVQVRVDGSFKVTTLNPSEYDGAYPNNRNLDDNWRQQRLDNQMYYRVSTEKEVTFYYRYKDPADPNYNDPDYKGIQLYDMDGNELKKTVMVRLTAQFSYWDQNNECPIILPGVEEKYAGLFEGDPRPEGYSNNELWKGGAIIDNDWHTVMYTDPNGNQVPLTFRGISGMDFVLSNRDDSESDNVAVEIVKLVVDENNNLIKMEDDTVITNTFKVYSYAAGNPDDVKDKFISPSFAQQADINALILDENGQPLYNLFTDKEVDATKVLEDGLGVFYVYNVPNGMIYIEEDSTPMVSSDGAYTSITDENGEKWVYKETRIETEYVWRGSGTEAYGRHISKGYTSVPEVIGYYGYTDGDGEWHDSYFNENTQKDEKLFNRFLEFYVYNVYTNKGSLKIRKTVTINGKPVVELTDENEKCLADGSYTFTVKPVDSDTKNASDNDDDAITISITIEKGVVKSATINGDTVTADEDGYITIEDLNPGKYTVTEEETNNGTSLAPGCEQTQNIEVEMGKTAEAVFVNNIDAVSINVTKTVSDKSAYHSEEPYSITIKSSDGKYVKAELSEDKKTYIFTGSYAEETGFDIHEGETLSFIKLPVGEYTVTEVNAEQPGYVLKTVYEINGDEAETATVNLKAGEKADITINNSYKYAVLVIEKEIKGIKPVKAADKITITVKDEEGHVLLDNYKFTAKDLKNNTYQLLLCSTDDAEYAQYIVPDGKYIVTETFEAPDNYKIVSSTYFIVDQGKEDVYKNAVSGTGYTVQLTDDDYEAWGIIVFTNTYESAPPDTGYYRNTFLLIALQYLLLVSALALISVRKRKPGRKAE